ncbi:MAG: hypothetical protein Q8K45_05360 [Rubrivivax sp.]|nr:hypothetical protein [Rubrivivax sp.]
MKPLPAPGVRRWQVGVAALVLKALLLGLLVWWLWREPADLAPDTRQAAAGATASSTMRVAGAAPSLRAARTDASGAAPAAVAHATAPAHAEPAQADMPLAPGAAVWDLCGVGRLPVPAGAAAGLDPERALAALPAHLGRDAYAQAHLDLFAALDAGPPRWRAAAVMLRGTDAAGVPQALALPALARQTDDPVVVLWAQQRCDLGASCLEMVERWALVEPQNLAPWARLLALQPQRREELIARMAAAKRFDLHGQALSLAVLEALPASLAPYLQPGLWIDVIGIEAAMTMPSFKALFDHCREPLRASAEVQWACRSITATLLDRSDEAVGVGLGLRLAERAGLATGEVARRRAELQSWQRAPEGIFDAAQPLSCAGVARMRAWVEARARLGEMGALRARAEHRAAASASGTR